MIFIRDSLIRTHGNVGSAVDYKPKGFRVWQKQPEFKEPPLSLDGAADHCNRRLYDDYYSQPGKLFRLMSSAQQKVLFENTARSIAEASKEVKIRHIGNCFKVDPAYGEGVAKAIGINLS